MKRLWVLLGSFLLGANASVAVNAEKPPKVEDSTPESARDALKSAASEADAWAGTQKTKAAPPPEEEAKPAKPTQAAPAQKAEVSPSPVKEAAVPEEPTVKVEPRKGLNEMKGKLLSKSDDPSTMRLITASGISVEFTYDLKTVMHNGGSKLSIDDINYNDELIIRYAGKDLYAIEVDRVSKAPRPE